MTFEVRVVAISDNGLEQIHDITSLQRTELKMETLGLTLAEGKSILDPAVTARVIQLVKSGTNASRDALAVLSPQERKVLALIAEGQTNKEVASQLGLAEKTVKNYLSNIFEKLHVSRRSQAAAMFVRESR